MGLVRTLQGHGMKTRITFLSMLLVAAATGCGSSSTPAQPTATQPSAADQTEFAKQLCEARREPACSTPEKNAEDEVTCRDNPKMCFARIVRPEAVAPFVECMKGRGCTQDERGTCQCGKSDDDCFHEAGIALPASPVRDRY